MGRAVEALVAAWFLAASGAAYGQGPNGGVLDPGEQDAMTDTLQYALEYNPTRQAAEWVNPDTGRSGGVVPMATYEDVRGRPCREFVTTIFIGGREEQGYGTACRQPDGTWEIVAEDRARTPTTTPPPAQQVVVYTPPPHYYRYPAGFYGPYPLFLSFSYVYRSGYPYHGRYYLPRRDFRHRHPLVIREKVFVGPRIYDRYRWRDAWGHRQRFEHRGPGTRWDRELRWRDDSRRFGDGRRGRGGRGESRWPNPDDHRRSRDRGRR
ncbi:MAG: RT0821/Lpp0805 family surface protein [Deferrisomatales bacterium]